MASNNMLGKIWMLSHSCVNEFQHGYFNLLLSTSSKAKYSKESAPPMAAAGPLGPDLVLPEAYVFDEKWKSMQSNKRRKCNLHKMHGLKQKEGEMVEGRLLP